MRIKLNGDALSLYRILYGRQVKRVAKLNSNTIERKSGLGRNLLTKKTTKGSTGYCERNDGQRIISRVEMNWVNQVEPNRDTINAHTNVKPWWTFNGCIRARLSYCWSLTIKLAFNLLYALRQCSIHVLFHSN